MFPRPRRWADIAVDDSSDEFSDSELRTNGRMVLPMAFDDSYHSQPDSCLEDSKSGLNAAMCALTPQPHKKEHENENDNPTDFAFLLKPPKLSVQGSSKEISKAKGDEEEVSKKNIARQVPQSKKKRNQSGTHVFQGTRKRVRGGRAQPKSCSGSDGASNRLEEDGLDLASESTLAPFEMPEATEEVWQHRQESRVKDIQQAMAAEAYQKFCNSMPEDQHSLAPPDPYDRTISKRKWKHAVNIWRHQLSLAAQTQDDRREGEEKTPITERSESKLV